MGYFDYVYVDYVMIFGHLIKSLRPNKGKSEIPLFAILSVVCQIRETSLIWSSLILSHDCIIKFITSFYKTYLSSKVTLFLALADLTPFL